MRCIPKPLKARAYGPPYAFPTLLGDSGLHSRGRASSRSTSVPSPHPSSLFLPLGDSRHNPASVDFMARTPVWPIVPNPAFRDLRLKLPAPSSDKSSGRKFSKLIEFYLLFWRLGHFLCFAGPGDHKNKGILPARSFIVNQTASSFPSGPIFRKQIARTTTPPLSDTSAFWRDPRCKPKRRHHLRSRPHFFWPPLSPLPLFPLPVGEEGRQHPSPL